MGVGSTYLSRQIGLSRGVHSDKVQITKIYFVKVRGTWSRRNYAMGAQEESRS